MSHFPRGTTVARDPGRGAARALLPSLAILVVLAALAAMFLLRAPAPAPSVLAPSGEGQDHAGAGEVRAHRQDVGFKSREALLEHFAKHGHEFGAADARDYLRRAQELRDRSAGGSVLERVRADGVVTRFERGEGAFLAFDAGGRIRTFFRPNDGEAYFHRQASRERGDR